MPNIAKEKGAVALFAVFILSAVLMGAFYLFIIDRGRLLNKVTSSTVPSPAKSQVSSTVSDKGYILEKIDGQNTEKLFAISNPALFNIIRWNNLIIFSDGGQNDNGYPPDIQIKVHNIDTGKTQIIFSSKESANQFKDMQKLPDSLSDLQIINNTLYFSLGGYLRMGGTFWLKLPPSGSPRKIVDGRNGSILKLKDWYFIVFGEGDSCWSEKDFYLFDLPLKVAKEIVKSRSGCNEGEEYLGISDKGVMVLAYHARDTLGASPVGLYSYVTSFDILNPGNRKNVITREQMPSRVTLVLYSENKDQLLLIGDSLYIYNLASSGLKKIAESPKGVKLSSNDRIWEKDKICLDDNNGVNYELNLDTESLSKVGVCDISSSPTPASDEKVKFRDLINSLNLPSDYQLIEK